MRSDNDRLLDMLDAMDAIERRAVTKDAFDEDEMVRVWCLVSAPYHHYRRSDLAAFRKVA